ncbi:MAG: 16S rRNA (guanine(527)-N(7))-methyltransferase RsmG [Terracidiphilus sp.]
MNPGPDLSETVPSNLNGLLLAACLQALEPETVSRFDAYLSLILRWNARMNLTAVRDPQIILTRHFVESIACAQRLPSGIHSLLDFGSGAGFPGIPIALCRQEIRVTLAESQAKKAAFLQEAVRSLELSSQVFAGRAEMLTQQFDCVTLRAVDQMEQALAEASSLVRYGGWIAVMTTLTELPRVYGSTAGTFKWLEPLRLPGSDQRVLSLAMKTVDPVE